MRPTPMMAQYMELRAANPDCLLFYRMGDFYELFFEDAEIASRALGIVLTQRGRHLGQDIPMCGVPIERAEDYLSRLIGLGHRVAVCEQMENPAEAKKRGHKAIVRRDVVRLVTPGTITEDSLLDPSSPSLLVALVEGDGASAERRYGLAVVDLSTGRFDLLSTERAQLGAELARLEPKEIVTLETLFREPSLQGLWQELRAAITPLPRLSPTREEGERRLREAFALEALEAMGERHDEEMAAAGLVLLYIERTQIEARPILRLPGPGLSNGTLQIDAPTRASLELTRTLGGERQGSLLATIDRTLTPAGARTLSEWLAAPLIDIDRIKTRSEAVAFLVVEDGLRAALRQTLKGLPDMARSLMRLSLERGGPRDLVAVREGILRAHKVASCHEAFGTSFTSIPAQIISGLNDLADMGQDLAEELTRALKDEVPLSRREGGFIRNGSLPELDAARALQGDSRAVIAALQARYVQETGFVRMRVKHNHMLGYFLEVPQEAGEAMVQGHWRELFIHRQTMAGAMRFSTAELARLDADIASAGARALALEQDAFDHLAAMTLREVEALTKACDALALLDVLAALAELARLENWVRPVVDNSLTFRIIEGRHPVVEAALRKEGKAFVPNNADLSPLSSSGQGRITLLTGPNMGGKSTFLRQNALLAILAQIGSFVPAREAHIGIVDRLFSRVGAADDLARGRSTFMVEMVETATILTRASEKSLVILDEIGRGTATFDGLAIAFATVEHLHDINCCRSLFATHFHELTQLAPHLARLANTTMRVREWKGEVVFLHEVTPGMADRSYGIQVARLAGMPPKVVERAKTILRDLETSEARKTLSLDTLPLFAALSNKAPQQPAPPAVPREISPLEEALKALTLDTMTPREALETLYRLRDMLM
jgi:DNA mismatch repair protein MutS